ncbi:MAG TPA: class E sortase [Gaiellaceae bacterium]|jgi:sortase A
MRHVVRLLGTLLTVAGLGTLAWTVTVWRWQDPLTAVYTHYEQHRLASRLNREFAAYDEQRVRSHEAVAVERRRLAADAARFRRSATIGQPIGRIIVPRIGLNMVLVNGTDHDTLKKGPGRDPRTFMPGQSRLVYIAGHRTTYLAPFSHIDRLRRGDRVTIEMPYATFVYRITGHRIVPGNDLAVLASHGREALELQACHPRFFATHRYIAYALAVQVIPRGGKPLAVRTGPGPAPPYY